MSHKIAALMLAFVFSPAGEAQLDKIIGGLGIRNNVSDAKTASGLKEASRSEPITRSISLENRTGTSRTSPLRFSCPTNFVQRRRDCGWRVWVAR